MSLEIRADVRAALRERVPVVALESTLISHGLPSPQNLNVAREAEQTMRAEGAVPATIGVIGGVAKVGLDDSELEFLATAEGIRKLSARDLPSAVAKARHGATTVAATAHLAALAGVRLFATGALDLRRRTVLRRAYSSGRHSRRPALRPARQGGRGRDSWDRHLHPDMGHRRWFGRERGSLAYRRPGR